MGSPRKVTRVTVEAPKVKPRSIIFPPGSRLFITDKEDTTLATVSYNEISSGIQQLDIYDANNILIMRKIF